MHSSKLSIGARYRSHRLLRIVVACLVVIGATLLSGCGGGSSASADATRFATSYAGTWSGMWNKVDGTNGSASMVISVSAVTKSATIAITLSGTQFGFAGSQSIYTGTYDSTGINVATPSNGTSGATLSISTAGQFSGSVTNPSANITSVTYSGPSTDQSVTMNVVIHHTDGTTDTGTITLTKQTT